MVGIYKITNPNGKIYIGQSININERKKQYSKGYCKTQIKIHRSILKYGWEKHLFEVVEECEIQELNDKERYYQELYFTIGKNGLNLKLVHTKSRSGVFSKEICEKISIGNKGKIRTQEQRLNASIKNLGNKHSSETIKKFLGRKTRLGAVLSEEHKLKISKQVIDLNMGIYYNSIKECAFALNYKEKALASKLRGYRFNNTNIILI